MLDTANTYDDKVVLMRLLVQEDEGKVALVLKNMMKIHKVVYILGKKLWQMKIQKTKVN